MSKNIKEIGKELLGKSLNSFHRKTGLTKLEKNNEMQDGILNGILSQVDDAYIEKTEQSNIIHLDGSGDGVVVLDSIEGNTKVNLIKKMSSVFSRTDNINKGNNYLKMNHCLKPNTKYTRFVKVEKMTLNNNNVLLMCDSINDADGTYRQYTYNITKIGWYIDEITIPSNGTTDTYVINPAMSHFYEGSGTSIEISNIMIVEGSKEDNATVIEFFEGLQSSFEDKVNDEGKYEIEILSQNRNFLSKDSWKLNGSTLVSETKDEIVTKGKNNVGGGIKFELKNLKEGRYCFSISAKTHTQGDGSVRIYNETKKKYIQVWICSFDTSITRKDGFFTISKDDENDKIAIWLGKDASYDLETQFTFKKDFMLTKVNTDVSLPYEEQKQNKIKLLLDEPLRSLPNGVRDRLCVVNNKLVVERMCKEVVLNGKESDWSYDTGRDGTETKYFRLSSYRIEDYFAVNFNSFNNFFISDRYKCETASNNWKIVSDTPSIDVNKDITISVRDISSTLNEFKEKLSTNNIKLVYQLSEPYYEEVLNEYGEPILLEGYENGTIYIDSTIVPTTTVRYTPKMESFKTLKEVNNNNNLTTLDINENIIPYMMDVDYMIMEKELLLLGTLDAYRIKNNRRIGENDMTSMQKRTGEMLERLFRGKSLTEQEARERVIIYLEANKITAEQANYLNEVILEVYA